MIRRGAAIAALATLTAALLPAPSAEARDAIVDSFDGEPIVAHFFPAEGLEPAERAPTLLMGSGWGVSSETDPGGGLIGPYVDAGYNVLTWDARGFYESGGTAMIDHRDFEGRDVRELIDFVAAQPEALLDAPGDPRVGMNGPSYAGGIQLVTAGIDDRVDAIVPTITWNTLTRSLFQSRNVKTGWGLILAGIGIPTTTLPGVVSSAGIQTGNLPPQFYDTLATAASTGTVSDANLAWFADRNTALLLDRIEVPTLIVQGTPDTLFTLEEAHRSFLALEREGIPLKMMWFCGGHGACLTEGGGGELESGLSGEFGPVLQRKLQWLARYLKGAPVATGPPFEWIDEDGRWHSSDGYPLREIGRVRGEGEGSLVLTPGSNPGSGVVIFATPDPKALQVPIDVPPAGSHVVGEPELRLAYRATGVSQLPGQLTYVYAQLVDEQRNVVVNNLATPVPIELDGERHQIELPLERIASRSTASGYHLELTPQTSVYDIQRAAGTVTFEAIEVTLPLSAALRAAGGGGGGGGGAGDADSPASPDGGGASTGVEEAGGTAPAAGAGEAPADEGDLPFTGLGIAVLVAAGLASLVVGGLGRLAARRR
jgi:ABC-2 type transport system ATP-binding protein